MVSASNFGAVCAEKFWRAVLWYCPATPRGNANHRLLRFYRGNLALHSIFIAHYLTLSILPFEESHMIWFIITLLTALAFGDSQNNIAAQVPQRKLHRRAPCLSAARVCSLLCYIVAMLFNSFPHHRAGHSGIQTAFGDQKLQPGFVRKIEVETGTSR